MKRNFQIAIRFLLAKKRPMLMTLAGIVFGVAFFIVTQAQTHGFEEFFIRTVLGANGALRVQDKFQNPVTSLMADTGDSSEGFQVPLKESRTYIVGIAHPSVLKESVEKFTSVSGVSEVLAGRASVSSGFRSLKTEVLGIRMNDHLSVTDLAKQIRFGSLIRYDEETKGILIGVRLAGRLQIDIGDTLFLEYLGGKRRFRLAGIFETGVGQYDLARTFIHLEEARLLFNKPHGSSYLQVSLFEPDKAPQVALHLEETLEHNVDSWQEREKTWLEVFRVLRFSSGLTMASIIVIAGLGMFNTLAMIVMERQREIAILRSIGYSRGDIISIFLQQGMAVLMAGILLGWILALALTYGVSNLPIYIRGVFSADTFIVKWSLFHYLWAGFIATMVIFLASFLPARRAAGIDPGEVIRRMGG